MKRNLNQGEVALAMGSCAGGAVAGGICRIGIVGTCLQEPSTNGTVALPFRAVSHSRTLR